MFAERTKIKERGQERAIKNIEANWNIKYFLTAISASSGIKNFSSIRAVVYSTLL